jgi:hypothetical protein
LGTEGTKYYSFETLANSETNMENESDNNDNKNNEHDVEELTRNSIIFVIEDINNIRYIYCI